MKKFIAVAIAAVFAAGMAVAAEAPKGPQQVTNYGKKAVVKFNHDQHKDIACDKCHHNAKDGKFKCGDCHNSEPAGKTLKMQDAMHLKDKGACWACHRADDAKKKLGCNNCHTG